MFFDKAYPAEADPGIVQIARHQEDHILRLLAADPAEITVAHLLPLLEVDYYL